MLTTLSACFGCGAALRHTIEYVDGFCRECLERSRFSAEEELGGEA